MQQYAASKLTHNPAAERLATVVKMTLCAVQWFCWSINDLDGRTCISGLVVEYIVAIDVTRGRFPADAFCADRNATKPQQNVWHQKLHTKGCDFLSCTHRHTHTSTLSPSGTSDWIHLTTLALERHLSDSSSRRETRSPRSPKLVPFEQSVSELQTRFLDADSTLGSAQPDSQRGEGCSGN